MARQILFLPYHGFGHINPCLPLAALLHQAGHHVTFAGVAYFRQHLIQQGYPYHTLNTVPFGMNFEKWHNTQRKKENLYQAELNDRRHDTLYNLRKADLEQMLDILQPDLILLDALQATDFIVLYPYLKARGIAIAITYPLLPPDVLPGRPPHNSDALPHQTLRIQYDSLRVWFKKKSWQLRQKIRFKGYNDKYIIRHRSRLNNIPPHFNNGNLCLHPFRTANLDELILAPLQFDFPGLKPKPKQHFLGFLAPTTRTAAPTPGFTSTWNTIEQDLATGRKLIYCSFGTTDASQSASIIPFLKKLVHAVQRRGYMLVIASPDIAIQNALPVTPHVVVFPSVPQLTVLAAAHAFITHGGMNSVKEAIQAGVPMLVYPIHNDYDPRGNAARVEYHGLGIRGNITRDSEHTLGQKIDALLVQPRYRESVHNLRNINATAYSTEKILDTISRISPLE